MRTSIKAAATLGAVVALIVFGGVATANAAVNPPYDAIRPLVTCDSGVTMNANGSTLNGVATVTVAEGYTAVVKYVYSDGADAFSLQSYKLTAGTYTDLAATLKGYSGKAATITLYGSWTQGLDSYVNSKMCSGSVTATEPTPTPTPTPTSVPTPAPTPVGSGVTPPTTTTPPTIASPVAATQKVTAAKPKIVLHDSKTGGELLVAANSSNEVRSVTLGVLLFAIACGVLIWGFKSRRRGEGL